MTINSNLYVSIAPVLATAGRHLDGVRAIWAAW